MNKANAILIVGALDPLAFRVKNFARQAGIPCDTLTSECLLEVQSAVLNKSLDDCYIQLKNSYVYPKKYSGILSSFLCNPATGEASAPFQSPTLERYWSEWNAFIGTILSLHSNVLNPPFYGALNGHQPSIFWQITAISHIKGINIPSIQQIAEHVKFDGTKELHNFYSINDRLIANMVPLRYKTLEPQFIHVIFVDEEIVCNTSLSNREIETINKIISEFRATFSTRLGELNITKYKNQLYFRNFIARPNLSFLPWKEQISTLKKIVVALCGRSQHEHNEYLNNR